MVESSHPYESLVVAVGTDHVKNAKLVRFAESICRTGRLTMRLFHVYEPVATAESLAAYHPLGVGHRTEEVIRRAEASEVSAANERLAHLAATVGDDVRVSHAVMSGEIVPCMQSFVKRQQPCILLVGASPAFSTMLPVLFSPSLALIEDMDVPVIALPHDADIDLHMSDLRLLVADDLRDESTALLATSIDFLRTMGRGQIVDTHVKNLSTEMFGASLADVFVTALGRPPEAAGSPAGLVSRIRPRIKRLLNERAARVFARKERGDVGFHSMVLRGNIVKELRDAVSRIKADMLVFGRHKAVHRNGNVIGHVNPKMMLSFRKPVLIVPV